MKEKLHFIHLTKNFILTVGILLTAGIKAQITTFPWMETFEDNSPTRSSWTQIFEVNNMSWTFVSSPTTGGSGVTAYEGVKFANYPADSHNFDKTKLVSPILDLSGVTNPTVSFYYRNPYWNPDQNWLRVFYRVSPTSPWVQIAEYHSNVTAWTSSGELALPSPSATYQIAVECETDYGYSTTVDALVVQGSMLAVDEVSKASKSSISYYPNPVENVLSFKSSGKVYEIVVYNSAGQKVKDKKVDSDQGQLDLSDLASGNYIIRGKTGEGVETFKIIKK